MDPLPVSPYDNGDASFQIIAVSALEVYPEAVVVPGLMIANTDTKHYASLAARKGAKSLSVSQFFSSDSESDLLLSSQSFFLEPFANRSRNDVLLDSNFNSWLVKV